MRMQRLVFRLKKIDSFCKHKEKGEGAAWGAIDKKITQLEERIRKRAFEQEQRR